ASVVRIERQVPADGAFIDVPGARVHYVDRGAGRPIVLLHGIGAQLRNFAYGVADDLASEYRVILMDRPGSGYSMPTGDQPGILGQAAVVAAFIDKLGLDRPLLVGHSLGGAIALGVATHHPDAIGGLALLAPLTQPAGAMPAPMAGAIRHGGFGREAFANLIGTPLAQATFGWRWGKIFAPESVPADFATRGGAALGNRPMSVDAAMLEMASVDDDMAAVAARYGSLSLPVAMLYGRDDQVVDPAVDGEHARLAIVGASLEMTEGGHMLPVTHPQVTGAFIRASVSRMCRGLPDTVYEQ
ncbi:MAG: alpha/beta hydrolase, partial [Sphingomonas sp.]